MGKVKTNTESRRTKQNWMLRRKLRKTTQLSRDIMILTYEEEAEDKDTVVTGQDYTDLSGGS